MDFSDINDLTAVRVLIRKIHLHVIYKMSVPPDHQIVDFSDINDLTAVSLLFCKIIYVFYKMSVRPDPCRLSCASVGTGGIGRVNARLRRLRAPSVPDR